MNALRDVSPANSAPATEVPRPPVLQSLQAGRFLAAFAVVLFHGNAILALPKYLGQEPLPILRGGQSGVAFFFVLSGFVICLAHGHELGGRGRPIAFLRKRCRRIYPALWIVLLAVLAVQIAAPSLRPPPGIVASDVLLALLCWPAAMVEPLLAVEWTLRHEMLFYFVFAICLLRFRAGLLLALALAIGSVAAGFAQDPHASILFSPYNLLFGFGVAVAIAFRKVRSRVPALWIGAGAILFLVSWAGYPNGSPTTASYPLLSGLGAALLLFGAASLERAQGLAVPRALRFLGDASYAVYLVHFPALSLLAKLAVRLPPAPTMPALLLVVLALGATLAGVCFHLAIERPLLRRLGAGGSRRPNLG